MIKPTTRIPLSSIILDEEIYPRKGIDHRRVGIFAENIRDGFKFEPIELEPDPDKPGRYRLLDGVHRWSAFKAVGVAETDAIIIKDLDGTDPLLYLAKMPELANLLNTDLSRGFTVSQVAEKHCWTEPMVWSLALEGKEDL